MTDIRGLRIRIDHKNIQTLSDHLDKENFNARLLVGPKGKLIEVKMGSIREKFFGLIRNFSNYHEMSENEFKELYEACEKGSITQKNPSDRIISIEDYL